MARKLFSVYDSKSESYTQPWTALQNGEALRQFEQAANDESTKVGKWPEDHSLFELGTFDERTAEITLLKTPISHGLALHYKKSNNVTPISGAV